MLIILFAGLSHFSQYKDFRPLGGSLGLEIAWSWWVVLLCQLWDCISSPMPTVRLPSGSISLSLNRSIKWKSANTSCLGLQKNKEKCHCCRKDVISWKYTVLELDYGSLIHFWWINLNLFNGLFIWTGPRDVHKSVYTIPILPKLEISKQVIANH